MKFITVFILLFPFLMKGQGEVPANYEFQIPFDSVEEARQFAEEDIIFIDDRELWVEQNAVEMIGSLDSSYFFAASFNNIDTFPMYTELVVITMGVAQYKALPLDINGVSKIISHQVIQFGGKKILKVISSYQFRYSSSDPLEEGQHVTLIDLENDIQLCSFEYTQRKTYNTLDGEGYIESENYLFEIGKNSISFYLANEAKGDNEITPSNKSKLLKKGSKPTFSMDYNTETKIWKKK